VTWAAPQNNAPAIRHEPAALDVTHTVLRFTVVLEMRFSPHQVMKKLTKVE
jgi:hypothetical protein